MVKSFRVSGVIVSEENRPLCYCSYTMTVCQSLCTYGLARRIRETLRKPVEDLAFESAKTNPDPCLQPCPHTADRGEENDNSRGYPE